MLLENENVPAMERLAQHELNLDVEGQKGLDAMVEQEATRVREEIEWEILAKRFLRDVLKRQCWDSLKVKSRSVKGFHCEHEVKNYPLKERTEKEVEEIHRVQNMRKIEMAAITLLKSANEEEQDEEDLTTESDVVTGSFSAQFGYSNPYIYDQFSVRTTEQKINQIILLQDVIHRIKTAFNAEFDAVHRQKVQELNHVRERNRHIREILLELDMRQELWEPSLTNSEWPERLFTVDDSEIKAEKYLSPEQREEEERKELEEQKHLAAKGDNFMKKGLDDMMDGLLEVKKEEILKMEITQPEFALTKPDSHWSEEEKKVYKLYEKKTKDLSEKKEKYKKEKLKITSLVYSMNLEEEMRSRELELKLKLERTLAYKDELMEEVKRHEEEVEMFLETYDTVVAEDKVNVKAFTLAKIQKLLQKRRVEKEAAQQEIKNLSDELKSLHKEKNRFLMDIMVQVIVKQGQVYTTDETADFPEYVLLHKGVVEDLNKTIRMLGGQNIASMVQRKDFRKNTFLLEWEHKHRRMQIEDLNNKARDIRRLHLSEEQQDYLNNSDQKSRVSTQVSILEKTIVYQEKAHLHNLQHYKNKIEEFTKQATMKEEINTVSEQQLPNMQVTVAERRHIFETTVKSQAASEGRHREIVQKKNLEDFAKAQAEELILLWAEVERLRMKNFPSLDHLKQLSKENL
ncbi:hypothetical protein F2P81_020321 [Scophthalmus maximus]|uniref:Cilia-and flagella-associated protein 43 n=1 Tax=Scophthalmus maximus TaxID=52904 RepID=A0A6A4S7P5_SCOMX|nr:hypothetical protein F2P81_020321 [Scophthalmus maximus]